MSQRFRVYQGGRLNPSNEGIAVIVRPTLGAPVPHLVLHLEQCFGWLERASAAARCRYGDDVVTLPDAQFLAEAVTAISYEVDHAAVAHGRRDILPDRARELRWRFMPFRLQELCGAIAADDCRALRAASNRQVQSFAEFLENHAGQQPQVRRYRRHLEFIGLLSWMAALPSREESCISAEHERYALGCAVDRMIGAVEASQEEEETASGFSGLLLPPPLQMLPCGKR